MILQQTIWGALEKNVRLRFWKCCVNRKQFALLLIKQKHHNKRFGEFEYFGGSDVVNKSFIVKDPPLEVVIMPKRQMKMRRTISIGWSAPIYENVDEPENFINFNIYCVRFFKKVTLPTFYQSKAIYSPWVWKWISSKTITISWRKEMMINLIVTWKKGKVEFTNCWIQSAAKSLLNAFIMMKQVLKCF